MIQSPPENYFRDLNQVTRSPPLSLLSYYPEPFEQRSPQVRTLQAKRLHADLWRVELPNGEVWHLYAISESAAIKQARQLWELTRSGAIGGEPDGS